MYTFSNRAMKMQDMYVYTGKLQEDISAQMALDNSLDYRIGWQFLITHERCRLSLLSEDLKNLI